MLHGKISGQKSSISRLPISVKKQVSLFVVEHLIISAYIYMSVF